MSDQPGPSKSALPSSSSAAMSSAERMSQLNDRFRKLNQLKQESRRLNKADVVEEDRKMKNPKLAAQEARKDWELQDLEERKRCEESGLDFERVKALNTGADIAWKKEAARKRKKSSGKDALVTGDYETMSLRQNERLTKHIKPDMESYRKMKEVLGEEQFFPTANTIADGHYYPTDAALKKMSDTVHEMIKTREKVHRRRMFDPDSEVTYINEKNRVFNAKLDKFYGKYTEDLREDLERGTAL